MTSLLPVLPVWAAPLPIADTHLHYNQSHHEQISNSGIIRILEHNKVPLAVVTSSPASLAMSLHRQAPERIVPLLGVYEHYDDKQTWHQNKSVPEKVRRLLGQHPYRGIGELHLFFEQRHSPVFRELVSIAASRQLPLLMHCDPAVIDQLFEYEPEALVIWAHAGAYPYPRLLRDYLARYPTLYVDLSMRNERIAPEAILAPEWENLLLEFPDRFMVGVDTFSTKRWQQFGQHIQQTRDWLDQLPEDVAQKIAFENTRRLFPSGRQE
jgi:hypothetical protein